MKFHTAVYGVLWEMFLQEQITQEDLDSAWILCLSRPGIEIAQA